MIIFLIFVLAVCIWMIWYLANNKNSVSYQMPKNTPLEILKRRFAKGEITEDEYDNRRAVLEEDEYLNTYP